MFRVLPVLATCLGLVYASPINLDSLFGRNSVGVTSAELANFILFSQYSAAAYCTNVVDDSSTVYISCASNGGECAEVEALKPTLYTSFYQVGSQKTTGYVAIDSTNELIVVVIQGTPGLTSAEFIDNLELDRTDTTICGDADTNDSCEIHSGYLEAWQDVQSLVETALESATAEYPTYKIIFTGHSLGAAVAAIGTAVERNNGYVIDLYNYGQPRIGAQDISAYITNQAPALGSNYRVTDYNDLVPQYPAHTDLLGADWDHLTPEYYITINGTDITTSEINVITTPLYSTAGNSGWTWLTSSITAHREYFGYISACS
jgi:triacylglycerol lipase